MPFVVLGGLAAACAEAGAPWLYEFPEPWEGDACTTQLQEAGQAMTNAVVYSFDQCKWGAESRKPTSIDCRLLHQHFVASREMPAPFSMVEVPGRSVDQGSSRPAPAHKPEWKPSRL